MNIAFLTCEELAHKTTPEEMGDEGFLVREFEMLGHRISVIPWDSDQDWKQFDRVIIRTTWDYATRAPEFLKTLEKISKVSTLINPFETVRWNIHKSYLLELERKGITIVPTLLIKGNEEIRLPSHWKEEKFVIKPAISATAYKTMILNREELNQKRDEGDWLCQPFMPQISKGEISLIYFHKKFSHALLKVPQAGDFRVQAEWGGSVIPFHPDAELLARGQHIVDAAPTHLYARVDVIPYKETYALMELELIEPALYFRTSKSSAKNFTKAFLDVEKKSK